MVALNILLLSDLHLEYEPFVPSVNSADVVVLAGDIGVGAKGVLWAKDTFDVPVVYVSGNHEYHDPCLSMAEHKELMLEACVGTNVSWLDNDVVTINGVRFIGSTLWADLKGSPSPLYCDIDCITVDYDTTTSSGGVVPFNESYAKLLFKRNRAWLMSELNKSFDGKTVVVTHHAPSFGSLHRQYETNPWNSCYISDLEALMGENIDVWVHGHTHNSFDYTLNGTRIICNPRGYLNPFGGWENKLFDSNLIIDLN